VSEFSGVRVLGRSGPVEAVIFEAVIFTGSQRWLRCP